MALRIALVHKRLDLTGGTERDLHRTAEGLRDLGHEVHLFCSEYGVAPPEGIFAHRVPVLPLGRSARLWSFAARAPKNIASQRCDLAVSFGRMLDPDVLRCGGGTHRGFLTRLGKERGWRRRLWQKLSLYHRSLLSFEERQFRAPGLKKIIAVSEEVKRDIIANYAVSGERIAVLYNGVDESRFTAERRQEYGVEVRRLWQIPAGAPLVLFVGHGFRRKGLDRLLAIWNSPRLAGAYLLVVGGDSRIERYRRAAEKAARGRIRFAGPQAEVEKFYAAADALALPSVQEAFGNVVLEGLASGLPILISRSAGGAEILTGSLAEGVVDHPENPAELENKLLALMKRGADPRWAEEARAIARQYSWKNHFQILEGLLLAAASSESQRHVA